MLLNPHRTELYRAFSRKFFKWPIKKMLLKMVRKERFLQLFQFPAYVNFAKPFDVLCLKPLLGGTARSLPQDGRQDMGLFFLLAGFFFADAFYGWPCIALVPTSLFQTCGLVEVYFPLGSTSPFYTSFVAFS